MKLVLVLLVVALVIPLTFYPQALSQNFKMFTDGLDSFGGRASSVNFSERIVSGGQPVVVDLFEDSIFYAWQDYLPTAAFVHGAANADGNVTIADVVYLMNYVLKSGAEPIPMETGYVDGNNIPNITDEVYLVNYLFKGEPAPCNL